MAPWEEAAQDAEDDAVSLTLGYLANAVLTCWVMGRWIEIEPDEEAASESKSMKEAVEGDAEVDIRAKGTWQLLSCVFFLLLVAVSFLAARSKAQGIYRRMVNGLAKTCTAMFAFTVQRLLLSIIAPQMRSSRVKAFMSCALFASFVFVLVVFVIDKIADFIRDRHLLPSEKEDRHASPPADEEDTAGRAPEYERDDLLDASPSRPRRRAAGGRGAECENDDLADAIPIPRRAGSGLSAQSAAFAAASGRSGVLSDISNRGIIIVREVTLPEVPRNEFLRKQEATLRTVIGSFAIVVALSWEMAFNISAETLAKQLSSNRSPHRGTQLAIALLTVAFVLPAWVRFLVPMSYMPISWHHAKIEAARAAEIQHPELDPEMRFFCQKLVCCCCCRSRAAARADGDSEDSSSDPGRSER